MITARFLLMFAIAFCCLCIPSVQAIEDQALYDFTADHQGWILQAAERRDDSGGGTTLLDYTPFTPEDWDDLTRYPQAPGADAADNSGAFRLGLALRGVHDSVNPDHSWTDAVYVQSEDSYTHAQSGWPEGYEQHPDYTGAWTFGHYPIGAVGAPGDDLRARVYCPGFTHPNDPVEARLYARSGPLGAWSDGGVLSLEHGWNLLRLPVSSLSDPADLRELGVKVASNHTVFGNLYVDEVTVGDVAYPNRLIYMTPDVAYFSEATGYDSRTVSIYYDDGGAASPGMRGFSIVLDYPQDCVAVTAAAQGDFLTGTTQFYWDDDGDRLRVDWAILGQTSGKTGFGKLATVTFTAADPLVDCCAALAFIPGACRFRDPNNVPITNLSFAGGTIVHDIAAPGDPLPVCTSHPGSGCYSNADIAIDWDAVEDAQLGSGHCAVGMRGYYLLLDGNPTTVVDAATADWFEPHIPETAAYHHTYSGLADGTYYLHLVAYDWLWNASAVVHVGPICVDTSAPGPVAALQADVTDESNLSVDLSWAPPSDPDVAGVEIYRMGTAVPGSTYPEYDDDPAWAAPPAWPATRQDAIDAGWSLVGQFTGNAAVDTPPVRDYYYYIAFAYDASVPANYGGCDGGGHAASLSYWLGDFDGIKIFSYQVDFMDVMILSLAYNENEGDPNYNNICDIGPTSDYGRKSLPTTDNMIEFEDLIVLAMNYEWAQGKREPEEIFVRGDAVQAKLLFRAEGEELRVSVVLGCSRGVKGAAVQLGYARGLEYLGSSAGDLWSDAVPFYLDAPRAGSVSLDCAALSGSARINGTHAIARFRVRDLTGDPAAAVWIERVRARSASNVELGAQVEAANAITPPERPAVTALYAAVPNPASRDVFIKYAMSRQERVAIRVFDATGRAVKTLVDEIQAAGLYETRWDGTQADGTAAPAGVYFCRMRAGGYESTRKLMRID
ncbi:MAG: T9SS type A sorting domain-containing protein [Candidatus Eisenbacteria bacterium]|nr:T9SS type A sorting domain-containing protein [Candidatus Eisenbacteria bacterium]